MLVPCGSTEAACNVKCTICMQTFLQTVREPAVSTLRRSVLLPCSALLCFAPAPVTTRSDTLILT